MTISTLCSSFLYVYMIQLYGKDITQRLYSEITLTVVIPINFFMYLHSNCSLVVRRVPIYKQTVMMCQIVVVFVKSWLNTSMIGYMCSNKTNVEMHM